LVTALDQIKLGMLTITEASVKYLIPRRTLWRKVKKGESEKKIMPETGWPAASISI